MAHGQSSDPIRRAGWRAVACGLTACVLTAGCTGPDKDEGTKSLDPSTKQRLLSIAPPAGKPGTGNASVDQRFNRTTPIRLPSPELGSANPAPAPAPTPAPTPAPSPSPAPSAGMPSPQQVGTIVAPTMPTNAAAMSLQPTAPVQRTAATVPQPPAPLAVDPLPGLPPVGGLPTPGGPVFPPATDPSSPTVGGPSLPAADGPVMPTLPPATGLPPVGPVGVQPAPPLPGHGVLPLPEVPGFPDPPPLVR